MSRQYMTAWLAIHSLAVFRNCIEYATLNLSSSIMLLDVSVVHPYTSSSVGHAAQERSYADKIPIGPVVHDHIH